MKSIFNGGTDPRAVAMEMIEKMSLIT